MSRLVDSAKNHKLFNSNVVISGIGGRYPESLSVDEFAKNLYDNVDLVTENDRRWPTDLYDMNHRMGQLKELDKFDCAFFSVAHRMSDFMDPQGRILLETAYEAICDSGINPQSLRGSLTGVYVGMSNIGMPDGLPNTLDYYSRSSLTDAMSWIQGTAKCVYANRISYCLDFHGPSMVIDTACSASMVALDIAVTDMRLGKCDQAIVAGVNINLQPFTNFFYQKLGLNAPDGYSKVWDNDADGFVRGETVASLFLQHEPAAKRIYARVINSRTNIDGYKQTGMFFPSSDGQRNLLIDTLSETNVHPNDVTYFEAHGTGTKVGDYQEAFAIYRAYCTRDRTTPLPIGLLKSNIGHSEAASGVASVTKVAIAYENECIPANLHMNKFKDEIEQLKLLKPIVENISYKPGIVGINSFGVGGVNAHVLLEPNTKTIGKEQFEVATVNIPRLVLLHGRTKEAVQHLMDFFENNDTKITTHFLALIADVFKFKPTLFSSGFPYRASIMLKKETDNSDQLLKVRSEIHSTNIQFREKLCFFYSGIGGKDKSAIAQQLLVLDVFASKLSKLCSIMSPHGIDLYALLTRPISESLVDKFVTTTALQIIFTDIFTDDLEIVPDIIVGHSFGEIAAAYAQGYLSAEEALLMSYHRGLVLKESRKSIPVGLMAAVGLSFDDATALCPKNVYVACNNGPKLVTISGEEKSTRKFLEKLRTDGVFVVELDSDDYPLHTPYLNVVKDKLKKQFDTIFANTRKGKQNFSSKDDTTLKWISTAETQDYMDILHSCAKDDNFCDKLCEYFLTNLLKPVDFAGVLRQLNSEIFLEISHQDLFKNVIANARPSLTYLSALKANSRTPETFLHTLAALYHCGFSPSVERLYPEVQWPVARGTQSISSLMKWDHTKSYLVKLYPEYYFKATSADLLIDIDPEESENEFFYHHSIGGSCILPGSALLFYAWRRYSESAAKHWSKLPVQFEDVQLRRAVFLDKTKTTTLKVRLLDPLGDFAIFEGANLICTGVIKELPPNSLKHQKMLEMVDAMKGDMLTVTSEDIYKDFLVRGYEFGAKFRNVLDYTTDFNKHSFANIRWSGNIIIFLDSLLQVSFPISPIKELLAPVVFPLIRCDPNIFFKAVNEQNIMNDKVETLKVKELIGVQLEESEFGTTIADEMRTKMDKITGEADNIKTANSVITTYHNADCKASVAPGIEVMNFHGFTITRKMDPVTVESYEFVPHHESAIDLEDKQNEIEAYIKVCRSECRQLLDQLKLNSNREFEFAEMVEGPIKEKYINLKEGNSLLKLVTQSRTNLAANPDKSLAALLQHSSLQLGKTKSENATNDSLSKRNFLNYLQSDMIANFACEERFIRPLVDLVAENFSYLNDLSVLQLSPVPFWSLSIIVDKFMASSSVSMLNISYTVAHPPSEHKLEIPSNFTKHEWNIEQDSLWPANLQLKQSPNLIVLHDEPLLGELLLNSEQLWNKLSQSVLSTGFVLVLFRTQFASFERLICEAILNIQIPTDRVLQERMNETINSALMAQFVVVASKCSSFGHSAVLFRKNQLSIDDKRICNIFPFDQNIDNWLKNVQDKQKSIVDNSESKELVWLLADGKTLPGAMGFFNCFRKEPGGRQFRLLYLSEGDQTNVVELFEKHKETLLKLDLIANVYKDGAFGTYRHFTRNLSSATRLSSEYHLNMGQKSYINSLTLYDSTHCEQLRFIPQLKEDDLLEARKYAIYSSSLNFRDLMMSLGRIHPSVELLTHINYLGTEFAGRDCATGERVFGFCLGGSLGSTVYVKPDYVRPMPQDWTYDDASGAVTTYFTVWYGLVYKAHLQPNSTVLIHSAAGGVGQAALHVCKAYGCTIFATVGSEEKRHFLQEHFQIPASHIFSSRDCEFETGVRELTNGKGVKYILNSLIGEALDASLRLIADNGHFIELAKLEMQFNKKIGTFAFLRNLSYHGIAIENPIVYELHIINAFLDWFLANCKPNQAVRPITCKVFALEDALAAFKFFMSGTNIGKIVLQTRKDDTKLGDGKHIAPCKPLQVQMETFFDPRKTYIVIGGCGGVGIELAHWLVRKGAKRIVLTSRSPNRTPYQTASLEILHAAGEMFPYYTNSISVYTKDISNEEGIRNLIIETQQSTNTCIGGVFHLAVSLNDCMFENISPELWHKTVDSKASIATLLDKVTRDICGKMDYFVCFSSIASGRGNIGQTNYGYANSVLEHICEGRRKDGLHGLALQYGPIGDVGVFSESDLLSAFASVRPQRIISCLEVLDLAMQSQSSVISSTVFVDRSKQEHISNANYLLKHLWTALGVDPETIPDHVTLDELGMESMFAVELQRSIEQEYNIRLTIQEIKQVTVGELKNTSKEKWQNELNQNKEFKKYLESINLSLPATLTECLNSATEGEPVFLLPTVIGIFGHMRVLAHKINRPVVALNITREINRKHVDIKSAAKYYMQSLQQNYPHIKRFDLIGFDYGALVALKMARKGFPCRVAVIDVRQSSKVNLNLKENKLYDQLITFLVEIMLASAFSDAITDTKTKERILRELYKEKELDGKVKAISREILKVRLVEKDQTKIDEMEELILGGLERTKALFEYDKKVSEKKDKLTNRLMVKFAKAKGQLLVIKNETSVGFVSKYLQDDDNSKNFKANSSINLHQHEGTLNSTADLINNFFD